VFDVLSCLSIELCIKCLHSHLAELLFGYRYMLGDDGQSLYVVFMGTKHMRDLLADANFLQEAVWKSKDPDKQQVISISLPLRTTICCIYRQLMYDCFLCSRHACSVGDAETSTNFGRLPRHTLQPSLFCRPMLLHTEGSWPGLEAFPWRPCMHMPRGRADAWSCAVRCTQLTVPFTCLTIMTRWGDCNSV